MARDSWADATNIPFIIFRENHRENDLRFVCGFEQFQENRDHNLIFSSFEKGTFETFENIECSKLLKFEI